MCTTDSRSKALPFAGASRTRTATTSKRHPDADVDRTTASVIYHRAFGAAATQTTLAWGRNSPNHGDATNTFLLESAVRLARTHTVFGRAERADKNELFPENDPRAEEKFRVGKLSVGYVYDFPRDGHLKLGVGGLASRYQLPGELTPVYGNPTSFMLFVRAKII